MKISKLFGSFLVVGLAVAANANLIRNASFETVPNSSVGEGLLPSDWVATGSSTPDTFSNDASYGLDPSFGGRFVGVTAHSGLRWTAANSSDPEEIAQTLTTPLVAGELYRLSAWLHRSTSTSLPDDGGFFVVIRDNLDAERLLGSFGATTIGEWEFRSFEFTAPSTSGDLPHLVFSAFSNGGTGAYVGLDDVTLEVVPEPSTLAFAALGGIALFVRSRRRK